jgi:hypothetical protein
VYNIKGRQKKEKKRETDVHLHQLAKHSTYGIFFKVRFGRFSARGVRKHEEKIEYVFKNKSSGKYCFGEICFPGEI